MKKPIQCMLRQNDDGKRVGVWEEELTRNYIKLVLAPEMGQGIMLNTVRKSRGISFLKFSGNPENSPSLYYRLFSGSNRNRVSSTSHISNRSLWSDSIVLIQAWGFY